MFRSTYGKKGESKSSLELEELYGQFLVPFFDHMIRMKIRYESY